MQTKNHLYAEAVAHCLNQIRHQQPLVHNITNYVAMPFNANALLAIGASPIMAHAIEEVSAIVKLAQALVINIGTLDQYWLSSMHTAMQAAKEKSIPIILDPVGVGASPFRTQAALSLIEATPPHIIRANASEIMALAGTALIESKGVDSVQESGQAQSAGKQLAERYGCTVVISGKQDFIIGPATTYIIENGVSLMQQVTAMGCTATALIGACCAVQTDYTSAAAYAMAVMGIAGELAFSLSKGPGSFQIHFLDALYQLQATDIAELLKLKQIPS